MSPRFLSVPRLVVMIAAAALVAPLAISPAAADPLPPDDATGTTTIYFDPDQTSSITVTSSGVFELSGDLDVVRSQCIDGGANSVCVGAQSSSDPFAEPLVVGGSVSGFAADDEGGAAEALGWIIQEGVDAITALYDLPADGRVQRLAGDQLRAYVLMRILDVLDRSLYGVELTPNEQVTLDYVNRQVLGSDRKIAQYAADEFATFQALECGYTPPAAPAFITTPVTLPKEVVDWCARRHTVLESAFVFAPPQPSADAFQAWGMYRHAADLGLDRLSTSGYGDAIADVQRAYGALAGAAIAGGAAAAAAAAAGAAAGVAGASTTALGTVFAGVFPHAAWGSALVPATAAGAAASVVAVVILAIVVTVVASIQLDEHEQVGIKIAERLKDAKEASDPFFLDDIRAQYAGLELREGMTPENQPPYRADASVARIMDLIVAKTSDTINGAYIPDVDALWTPNATTAQDYRFLVMDGSTPHVEDSITVPMLGDDETTVRFSRDWMIVDEGDGEKPALEFRYVDNAGRETTASRVPAAEGAPAPDGGFSVARRGPDGMLVAERTSTIHYIDGNGNSVSVALVPPTVPKVGGVRPSAVGPLTPGRTVILRPNPVAPDGTFDGLHETGFTYTWNVKRVDPATGALVEAVPEVTSYDTRFKPAELGDYRAVVRAHDTDPADGTVPDSWGVVDFRISAPATEAAELQLHDDGTDGLRISAQLGAAVPSDDFTIDVEWPGSVLGEPGERSSLDLECHTVDPMSCSTVKTDLFPDMKAELSHTLAATADLNRGVTVTITDRYGSATTQKFAIDDPARPTLAPPREAPGPDQPGVVVFDRVHSAVQIPVQVTADPNYELARLVPGTGGLPTSFGIVDPADDTPKSSVPFLGGAVRLTTGFDAVNNEWVLDLRVTAGLDDLGTTTFPVVIQQVTGARTMMPLTVDLVPASGDRFRAAVANEIDVNDIAVDSVPQLVPYVMGGRDEWGDYAGDLCVSLTYTEFPTAPVEHCGPVSDLLDANGKLTAISYPSFDADGLDTGRYEVTAHIPDAEHADATPFTVSFRLMSGPPTIGAFTWDKGKNAVRFTTTPFSAAAPITGYECRLDGQSVACPDATAGIWVAPALTQGTHRFDVSVTDAAGNYTTDGFEFTLKKATKVKPTKPPKPPKP
ncbi:hypothetical protein ACWGST_16195 [Agromyces sp. NPDC055520]